MLPDLGRPLDRNQKKQENQARYGDSRGLIRQGIEVPQGDRSRRVALWPLLLSFRVPSEINPVDVAALAVFGVLPGERRLSLSDHFVPESSFDDSLFYGAHRQGTMRKDSRNLIDCMQHHGEPGSFCE